MKKLLLLLLLIPNLVMAEVCMILYSPEMPVSLYKKCKEGQVLSLYISHELNMTQKSRSITFNTLKAVNCNHKYSISIFTHSDNALELSCLYKNNF